MDLEKKRKEKRKGKKRMGQMVQLSVMVGILNGMRFYCSLTRFQELCIMQEESI